MAENKAAETPKGEETPKVETKTMKIQFKTKVMTGTANGREVSPSGKVHTMDAAKAQAYIDKGLAVEVKAKDSGEKV